MKYFKQKDDLFKVEKWKLLVFYTIVLGLVLLSVILPISKQYPTWVRVIGICFLSIFVFLFASLIAHVCMQGNENRIKKIVLIALQGLVVGICVSFINLYDSLLIKMEFAIGSVIGSFILYQLFNFYAYTMDKICEKLFRILLSLSIVFIAIGTVLGFFKASWYFIFTKIGLGFVYFWLTVELIKRTLFNEKYSIKEELKKNSYYVAFTILIYVALIFTFPMYISWCGLNGKNFEYFITLYSCAIGGVITLGGVAWGIRNGKNEKREEEIKKAKPIFTYNAVYEEPKMSDIKKCCISGDAEFLYKYGLFFELENSNHSVFTIKRIMHDGYWFVMGNNNVVLPDSRVLLSILFDNIDSIYLEIEDCLQQCYYYKIDVFWIRSISNRNYTICGLKEVQKPESKPEEKNGKEEKK